MFYVKTKSFKLLVCSLMIFTMSFSQSQAEVTPPSNANLIFSSVFSGTWVDFQVRWATATNPGGWAGNMMGANWANLPSRTGDDYFNFAVRGDKLLGDYVGNTMPFVLMPWGNTEQVYHMSVFQNDPDTGAVTRIQQNWFPPTDVKDVYISYYMKLQDNLAAVMPDDGTVKWRQLMEFREFANGTDQLIRSQIMIMRKQINGTSYLAWEGRVASYDSFAVLNSDTNTAVPIPAGKWFLLTVHYKHGVTDGAFEAGIRVTADGGGFEGPQQTLFSFKNIKTTTGRGFDFADFMKLYAGTNVLAHGTIWQEIYFPRIWQVPNP